MKRLAITAVAVILAGAAGAAPEEATPTPAPIISSDLSGSDVSFFDGATCETALLAKLSGLAKAGAVTPEVRDLAAAVFKDQADAAAKLQSLAARKQISMNDEPDGQGKIQLRALGKLKGPKFDKSYLDALGDAQDRLQTSLKAGAASGDADIKAYANAALATLGQERVRLRKLGL